MKFRPPKYKTLIWDVETNGLLDQLDRVHCLVIREYESGQVWRFRKNRKEDTIEKGLRMLMDCALMVGHNIMAFDILAVQKVYPWFEVTGKIRDTLVMTRMIFAAIKEKDFGLWRAGKLPGAQIGGQGLEAWGYRLGLNKGDYKKDCEEKGIDPWARWNPDMEDYCENDVDVNTLVWSKCLSEEWSEEAIVFEHQIHDLMVLQQEAGIHFDLEGALELADEISNEVEELSADAIEHFGSWYAPDKKKIVRMLWNDPDGVNADKKYEAPDYEFGENKKRAIWAAVTTPKKTIKYKDKPWHIEGAAYCNVKLKEFKPTSRQMIIDRFTTIYEWTPTDFTDKGNPEVNDSVLRNLIGHIPMAEELAEIFYLQKRLGQIATGAQSWVKHCDDDGLIHHRVNTGGTVSGRCSHSFPNLAQVPRVVSKDKKILWGRKGKHGADCRSLFYVPEDWGVLVGCDLSGIELRCLANVAWEFDGGVLADHILNGDIHTVNQKAAGLPDRDKAKTFIYALIYGAGDEKIGSIVSPLADPDTQRDIGKKLRVKFLSEMPGLKKAIKKVQKQSRKGFLIGLDGRKLFVRGQHSALNLLLQHHGAMVAKLWLMLVFGELTETHGLEHGWDGAFTLQLFVHDEIQFAVKHDHVALVRKVMEEQAIVAGEMFGFMVPTAAESKQGESWLETH